MLISYRFNFKNLVLLQYSLFTVAAHSPNSFVNRIKHAYVMYLFAICFLGNLVMVPLAVYLALKSLLYANIPYNIEIPFV